jgi:serine phosphatase RsbU (regulator of sigma subunit)
MLGMSILNEVVDDPKITTAAEILESMRTHIKLSLRQSKDVESQDDGIDMALCIINKKTLEMQFAGANNSIYLVREQKLEIINATLNPVGIYFREIPFKNNIIQLQAGDSLYLFSDGFTDQFGGDDGRRFMSQNFKEMILESCTLPMSIQKTIYEKKLQNWQGKNRQIDDIALMGIRIDT